MDNQKLYEAVEQSGADLKQILHIGMCLNSSMLDEVLEDLDIDEIAKFFPKVDLKEWEDCRKERDRFAGHLIYAGYKGWLIEVSVPLRERFTFKEGSDEYSSCAVYPGITSTQFAYVENFEDIIPKIIEIDKMVLKEDIAASRKSKALK